MKCYSKDENRFGTNVIKVERNIENKNQSRHCEREGKEKIGHYMENKAIKKKLTSHWTEKQIILLHVALTTKS